MKNFLILILSLIVLCTTARAQEGTATTYYLQAYSHKSGTNPDYEIKVVREGESIRIKGLYHALPEAWIEGTMADGVATFASGQKLGEDVWMTCSTDMHNVVPLRIDFNPLNDTYEAYYQYVVFANTPDFSTAGEENYTVYEHLQNITFFSGSKVLVNPPANIETMAYRLEGVDSDTDKQVSHNVAVGAEGDEFYFQGLCAKIPEAWVKGYYDPQTGQVTLMRNQYLGQTEVDVHTAAGIVRKTFDIWFTGIDQEERFMAPVVFSYDAETGAFEALERSWIVLNGEPTKLHYLQILRGVTLTPIDDAPTGGENDNYKLVVPPADMPTSSFTVSGSDLTFTGEGEPLKPYEVKCGVKGSDIYVQGIFADLPEAWIKGTLATSSASAQREGGVITASFPAVQYLGKWYGQMDAWMLAPESTKGSVITFAAEVVGSKLPTDASQISTLRLAEEQRIVFTDNSEEIGPMPFAVCSGLVLTNASLSAISPLPVMQSHASPSYNLSGRRIGSATRGLHIYDGHKRLK